MMAKTLIPMMVLVPALGGLGLLMPWCRTRAAVWWLALMNSLVTLGLSLGVVYFAFQPLDVGGVVSAIGGGEVFFRSSVAWVSSMGLSFGFGIDALSLWLVVLTTFLMSLVILGSYKTEGQRFKEFYLWLLLLESALIGAFVATDLIFFYICFEFTLIPLYFLIGVFGSTQRLRAARVFFLYTLTGSMLTFAGLLYVAWVNASLNPAAIAPGVRMTYPWLGMWTFDIGQLCHTAQHYMSPAQQSWVLLALLAGFAVKVPLFPVHTWLPLAHTEAPTAGSAVLAGVLLKLGTYGLLRFAIPMTPVAVVRYAPVIGTLAVIGIVYAALVCWVQRDIKKLIAYSSVSHMGFCVLGLFALNHIGVSGSVMYMINHGLSTAALFLCVGMVYQRLHTRQMGRIGGLGRVMPVWSFFMVFFCFASVGLPGLNGFVGEFLTLLGAFTSTRVLGVPYAVFAGLGMVLSAVYLLYMVGRVVFGPVRVPDDEGGTGSTGQHEDVSDLSGREIATLAPLAAACLVLGLYPNPVLRTFEGPINQLTGPAVRLVSGPSPAVGGVAVDESETDLPSLTSRR